MAPVDEGAAAADEAMDSESLESESNAGAEVGDKIIPEEIDELLREKSSEEAKKPEIGIGGQVGGGKEVDESAAESIAQPETLDEKLAEEEEIEGPELTSDHLPKDPNSGHQIFAEEPKPEDSSEADVVNALYGRMSSGLASAHSDNEKEKGSGGGKDPLVDSVLAATAPFVQFAVAQAQVLKTSVDETADIAVKAACNQLGELQDSSTTHFYYAKDTFWRWKREYNEYENAFFSTLKDGVKAATANPGMAAIVATGAAFALFRRPRRFLFRHTLGRFRTQEAMLASAQKKVVDMRQAFEGQKHERRKLEERFRAGEDEFLRGHAKLANAGSQISSLVKTLYKTEHQAEGLVEKLRDISGKPALHLRAEVASMVSEAKQQRAALDKDLYKIANYNIRV